MSRSSRFIGTGVFAAASPAARRGPARENLGRAPDALEESLERLTGHPDVVGRLERDRWATPSDVVAVGRALDALIEDLAS